MYSTILFKKLALPDLYRKSTIVVDAISAYEKNAKSNSRLSSVAAIYTNKPSFLWRPNLAAVVSCRRHYCSSKNYRPFPNVPEFPPVVWPNLFKSIKALLYTYLIIKPQFDSEFSLGEFAKNSRKAVEVVSNCIASRDFTTLQGLVTNDVLQQVESIVSNLSDEEIKNMGFVDEDMYFNFPFELEIINDAKFKDRRFVEITMCYHAIHNLEEIKKKSEEIIDIQKELKSSIYVLNYRFIREYTEGVKDAWTINAINHLKAEEHDTTIL